MAMIVEDSSLRAQQLISTHGAYSESAAIKGIDKSPFPASRLKQLLKTMQFSQSGLSCRDQLMVAVLVLMFECDVSESSKVAESQAMLLHSVLLQEYCLSSRAISAIDSTEDQDFFQKFVDMAFHVLTSQTWKETVAGSQIPWNSSDLIDGRLFLKVLSTLQKYKIQGNLLPSACSAFTSLASLINSFCGVNLQLQPLRKKNQQNGNKPKRLTVPVFPRKSFHLTIQSFVPTCNQPILRLIMSMQMTPTTTHLQSGKNYLIGTIIGVPLTQGKHSAESTTQQICSAPRPVLHGGNERLCCESHKCSGRHS